METPGEDATLRPATQAGAPGPTPQDGVPAQAETGTHPQNPAPSGAEEPQAAATPGAPRLSPSRVGSGGGQSTGRGWGGEAGVLRGGDRKGPPGRGGLGAAVTNPTR